MNLYPDSYLLNEYKEGKKTLRQSLKALDKELAADKEDMKVINSMIRGMDFVIKWLEDGTMPEKNRREVLYDPDFLGQSDDYVAIDRKLDEELAEKRRRQKNAKST